MSKAQSAGLSVPMPVSILAGSTPDDIKVYPFPHLLKARCLSTLAYSELRASFPATELILGGRSSQSVNVAARMPAFKVLSSPAIAAIWRDFFAFHTSDLFWKDIVRVFGDALRTVHPKLEQQSGRRLEDWRAGPRVAGGDLDVRLDCQFVVNTPWPAGKATSAPWRSVSVKTAHVDKPDTILSGLLYFREPEDDSAGGDLDLYAWRREPRFLKPRVIMPCDIELRERIPYAANSLVAFVNSPAAAHGVTPRKPSPVPRRYINFIAEVPFKAFDIAKCGTAARLLHWPAARRLGSRDLGGDRY